MQEMKAMLKNELMDAELQERMKETAGVIVAEVIRREIADRVRNQVNDLNSFVVFFKFIDENVCDSLTSKSPFKCRNKSRTTNGLFWKSKRCFIIREFE